MQVAPEHIAMSGRSQRQNPLVVQLCLQGGSTMGWIQPRAGAWDKMAGELSVFWELTVL